MKDSKGTHFLTSLLYLLSFSLFRTPQKCQSLEEKHDLPAILRLAHRHIYPQT